MSPPLTNHWGEPLDRPAPVSGSCAERATNALMFGAGVGTFFGSLQAAWYPDPVTSDKRFGGVIGKTDAKAVFRTVARPAFFLAMTSNAYALSECFAEEFRGKTEDGINSLIGGMVAGAVMSTVSKRFDVMAATSIGTGLFMWGFAASGIGPVRNEDTLSHQVYDTLPEKHEDSDALANLKGKFPKYA